MGEGVQNWAQENGITLAFFPPVLAAPFIRQRWVQVLAPVVNLATAIAFGVLYYPALR